MTTEQFDEICDICGETKSKHEWANRLRERGFYIESPCKVFIQKKVGKELSEGLKGK